MVGMIVVHKSIPLSTNIFVSTIFNHSITECFISYESIMDMHWKNFLHFLFNWLAEEYSLSSRLFTISMSVRSSFLDDVVGNGKEFHRVFDEFLIFLSSFTKEVPARAIDDANVPV